MLVTKKRGTLMSPNGIQAGAQKKAVQIPFRFFTDPPSLLIREVDIEERIERGIKQAFQRGQNIFQDIYRRQPQKTYFVEIKDSQWRKLFDYALGSLHYAGACQRVGRCMRLAIIHDGKWVGGIVLGSPFPNIEVRDRALGLKRFVENYKQRGLMSPWQRENKLYWKALQRIINHARTFIFPMFQGRGLATLAHRHLLTEGVQLWERKYKDPVFALDNLCDQGDSKLFARNGWTLVGETKGYRSAPNSVFSKRVIKQGFKGVKNNTGLQLWPDGRRWLVWVKVINPKGLKDLELSLR